MRIRAKIRMITNIHFVAKKGLTAAIDSLNAPLDRPHRMYLKSTD